MRLAHITRAACRPELARLGVAGAVLAALLLAAAAAPSASPQPGSRLERFRTWLTCVRDHEAGRDDAAASAVEAAGFTLFQLREAHDDLMALVGALGPSAGRGDDTRISVAGGSLTRADARRLLAVPDDDLARHDPTRVLVRAAVLHADVGSSAGQRHLAFSDGGSPPASTGRSVVLANDGQDVGTASANVHWMFGRILLDGVRPSASRSETARLWYAALAAVMQSRGLYGDLSLHLERAEALFPDDPRIQFFVGAYHEALSSQRIQAAVRAMEADAPSGPGARRGRRTARTSVGEESLERQRARRAFENAVRLQPDFPEARLRLGRVLALQGRGAEAAAMLDRVLAGPGDDRLHYFAALFLGEARLSLGDTEAARVAFERAAGTEPRAQSPRLALSLIARARGERAEAYGLLASATAGFGTAGTDPWWRYDLAAGRSGPELLQALYSRLER
jgi:tetratricopeptide (TPR) repeat protein